MDPSRGEPVALYADGELPGTVTGTAPRSRVRAENLPHAATAVLLRNGADQVYVHRRTDTKDLFPGAHDCWAGGVVLAGEDPQDAARRELAEELGVSGVPLRELFRYWYADDQTRYLAHLYEARWDGPVVHQPSEVADGAWMDVAELLRRLEDPAWPFTPDGRRGVQEMRQRGLLVSPGGRRRGEAAIAAAADAAAVVVFAALGRRSHDEGSAALGVLRTAAPFLAGLGAGWLGARAWRAPWAPLRTGVPLVAGAVGGGMLLRALTSQGTAATFVVVASAVLGGMLVGWRALAASARRLGLGEPARDSRTVAQDISR